MDFIAEELNSHICIDADVKCSEYAQSFYNTMDLLVDTKYYKEKLAKKAGEFKVWLMNDKESFWEVAKNTFYKMLNKLTRYKFIDISGIDDSHLDTQGLIMAEANGECKHNFASQSSGAAFVDSPKQAYGVSNLLSKSTEKYLMVPCKVKKSFVISLSEDAIIDKFLLLNAEEFSSTIELFNLYGSDSYSPPDQKWEKLGSFMADNDLNWVWQSFKVKESWVRYLKFEWKTHYGSYHY